MKSCSKISRDCLKLAAFTIFVSGCVSTGLKGGRAPGGNERNLSGCEVSEVAKVLSCRDGESTFTTIDSPRCLVMDVSGKKALVHALVYAGDLAEICERSVPVRRAYIK